MGQNLKRYLGAGWTSIRQEGDELLSNILMLNKNNSTWSEINFTHRSIEKVL